MAVQKQISELRRKAGSTSPLTFAKAYLPSHLRLKPSRMHCDLFEMLQEVSHQRGARLAIAAPRGHAKSTIVSLAYVLWCICYRTERYIMLISNTLDQASDFLSQIKSELDSNELLQEDFPEVCEVPGSTPGSGVATARVPGPGGPPGVPGARVLGAKVPGARRWTRDEVVTRNDVRITALGADTKFRGRRYKQHRPTLIVLDDVESEVEVRSDDQRRYKQEWFNKTVLKAGTSATNVIVVGTILHYDALLANLIDPRQSPNWTGKKYQAVCEWSKCEHLWEQWEKIYRFQTEHEGKNGPNVAKQFFESNREAMLEGTKVLWPELEDYYTLMEMRISEGRASFDSEKQNEPMNPRDCYFQESDFHFWDDQFATSDELIAAVGQRGSFYGACDPSLGKRGKNADDTAIITLLRDSETGVLYVIDADIERRRPDAIIDTVIQYHRMHPYASFAMETNQYQQFLSDELQRRSAIASVYVPVMDIHNSTDKTGRIQSLQSLIKSGNLRLSRRHIILLEQLRQFPMGKHDDGPDALEMAVRATSGQPPSLSVISMHDEKYDLYDILTSDEGWNEVG